MIQIRSLAGIDADALYAAWSLAFSDYDFSWTKAAFDAMLQRRGYDGRLSCGAFDDSGKLVSFTLNRHHSVKAINVEEDCLPLIGLLEKAGIPLRLKQYEMVSVIP
jgi:hypothetical protein